MIKKLTNNNTFLLPIFLGFLLSTCIQTPTITKPVRKQREYSSSFKPVWNSTLPILVKSGGIIKNMNQDIGLIICEFILTPSQLTETVLEGGRGGGVGNVGGRQGKCVMNILVKEVAEKRTNVFLNTRFIMTTYSTYGGKLGESLLSSNGKIEEDFFEKLSLELGEKKYDWLTKDTKEVPSEEKKSPPEDQVQIEEN